MTTYSPLFKLLPDMLTGRVGSIKVVFNHRKTFNISRLRLNNFIVTFGKCSYVDEHISNTERNRSQMKTGTRCKFSTNWGTLYRVYLWEKVAAIRSSLTPKTTWWWLLYLHMRLYQREERQEERTMVATVLPWVSQVQHQLRWILRQ